MASQDEIEKLNQAAEFFNRYFEFEDAVKVSMENKEYLKTYIHDNSYVVKNFDLRNKILKSISLCAAIALLFYALLFTTMESTLILVSQVTCLSIFLLGSFFVIALNKYRLTAAENHQVEINEGISEQIELNEIRTAQLKKQRDDYYAALEKRITFMSLDYMKNLPQIKEYIEKGLADTCEDAVALFEQDMLMQQMNTIITMSEAPIPTVSADAKEKFGDPLKLIKENKRKKRLERRRHKQQATA